LATILLNLLANNISLMKVKNMVIHKLEKKQGEKANLTKAAKQLPITWVHQHFMSEVKQVYYNKSNPIYGSFDAARDSYPYQTFLCSYLSGNISFYDFTVKAVVHFENIINEVALATGGYVLFCHFEMGDDFVAVIVLNDKESYIINDNLDVNANARLDIEKLDVANFTNCGKWNSGEDVYLSFTRGKKEISNYFRRFIGCTDYASARESSLNLKRAINDYLYQNNYDKEQTEIVKELVFAYCEQQMKDKEDIQLSFVGYLINKSHPEDFVAFASSEKYQVSAFFKGHNTLKSLKYYSYNSKELTIIFDSKLLGNTVVYDDIKNNLLIKNIPDHLKHQLIKKLPISESDES
jgi:nucleoid-associated protein